MFRCPALLSTFDESCGFYPKRRQVAEAAVVPKPRAGVGVVRELQLLPESRRLLGKLDDLWDRLHETGRHSLQGLLPLLAERRLEEVALRQAGPDRWQGF